MSVLLRVRIFTCQNNYVCVTGKYVDKKKSRGHMFIECLLNHTVNTLTENAFTPRLSSKHIYWSSRQPTAAECPKN